MNKHLNDHVSMKKKGKWNELSWFSLMEKKEKNERKGYIKREASKKSEDSRGSGFFLVKKANRDYRSNEQIVEAKE